MSADKVDRSCRARLNQKTLRFGGLTRLDNDSATGWWVRLYLAARQPVVSKVFSDSKFGGNRKALMTAKAWRDEQARAHGIRRINFGVKGFHRRDARSSTVGVSLERDRPKSPTRVNWVVRFTVDGVHKGRSFSIRKYGFEAAWHRACAIREAHTGEPMPGKMPPLPEWFRDWAASYAVDIPEASGL